MELNSIASLRILSNLLSPRTRLDINPESSTVVTPNVAITPVTISSGKDRNSMPQYDSPTRKPKRIVARAKLDDVLVCQLHSGGRRGLWRKPW